MTDVGWLEQGEVAHSILSFTSKGLSSRLVSVVASKCCGSIIATRNTWTQNILSKEADDRIPVGVPQAGTVQIG